MQPGPARKNVRPAFLFLASGGVAALGCCGICGFASFMLYRDEQTFGTLENACHGRAVPGSSPYVPGLAHHGVVFVDSGAGSLSLRTDLLPEAQRASSAADADVVLCLGAVTTTTIETCTYRDTVVGVGVPGTESSKPRTQQVQTVRAVSPESGATAALGTITGPAPRSCETFFGHAPSDGDLEGDGPGSQEVGGWFGTKVP